MRTRTKTILGLALVSLSLVACMVESRGPDVTAEPIAQVNQAQTSAQPGAGGWCHVESQGIVFGTMTNDGWCCGSRVCDDAQACGADYGHLEASCGRCSFYTCESGFSKPASAGSPTVLLQRRKPQLATAEKDLARSYLPVKL